MKLNLLTDERFLYDAYWQLFMVIFILSKNS